MTITIHSGAFQNHIKKLPKGSVDLLVTDPPICWIHREAVLSQARI